MLFVIGPAILIWVKQPPGNAWCAILAATACSDCLLPAMADSESDQDLKTMRD
jgi:hypothetical protein